MTVVKGYKIGPRSRKRRLIAGAVMVMAFSGLGIFLLQGSQAATIGAGAEAEAGALAGNARALDDNAASNGQTARFGAGTSSGGTDSGNPLLKPFSMGLAPYAYLPYGDVSMTDYATGSGARNFFAAFILGSGSGGCTPLWDGAADLGLSSSRSTTILNEIKAVRAKGGDVAISFGGETGSELADSCTDATKLQAAYQSVIDKFALKHINFDIESAGETNTAGLNRRVQVSLALQKANPGLKISLTIPVDTSGLDADALNVVKKFHDGGVVLSSIDIMTMYFGVSTSAESSRVISAAQGTVNQLKQVYTGITTAEAYRALGIIPQLGVNQGAEVFTLADAKVVRDFAVQNGVGTLSYWSANRDEPCASNATASDTCSGVSQSKYDFAKAMTIPAL